MIKMFAVYETFASIQGESTHAGRLCFFIRLAGCNLACSYCDTCYAQAENSGKDRSIAELVAEVKASNIKLVEITGGEPAWQKNTPALAQALLDEGFEVLMETNGSVRLDLFPAELKKIIDFFAIVYLLAFLNGKPISVNKANASSFVFAVVTNIMSKPRTFSILS